jgi:hypothetical protein
VMIFSAACSAWSACESQSGRSRAAAGELLMGAANCKHSIGATVVRMSPRSAIAVGEATFAEGGPLRATATCRPLGDVVAADWSAVKATGDAGGGGDVDDGIVSDGVSGCNNDGGGNGGGETQAVASSCEAAAGARRGWSSHAVIGGSLRAGGCTSGAKAASSTAPTAADRPAGREGCSGG